MPTILHAAIRPMRIIVSFVLSCGLSFCGLCGASTAEAIDGKVIFQRKCASCHTIGGGDRVGPDLRGVTDRRAEDCLMRRITQLDQMIAERDPIAIRLLEQFNRLAMANLGLTKAEARALID